MHVLIIPSWYPSDAADAGGSFFREQAAAICKDGNSVGVIFSEPRPIREWHKHLFKKPTCSTLNDEGVNVVFSKGLAWVFFSSLLTGLALRIRSQMLFKNYVRQFGKPDVIHAHCSLYGGWAARMLSKKYSIPYVLTEHSSQYQLRPVTPFQKWMVGRVLAGAKALIAVSNSMAEAMADKFPNSKHKWIVLPNMVHSSFLEFDIAVNPKRRTFTFFSLSLMTKNKNISMLIRAFTMVCEFHPQSKLLIGGDGPERSTLEKLVEELGMLDKVIFLGRVRRERVINHMAQSDVFLQGSNYETFGVACIEALAMGKPVVSTNNGGAADIITPQNGLIVPVGDTNAFALAMQKTIENMHAYSATLIRADCSSRFSGAHLSASLTKVYLESTSRHC
jgi:glycosyltransferase involved in cell wall biosynthesis